MPSAFLNVRYHVKDKTPIRSTTKRGVLGVSGARGIKQLEFEDDETAARFYLKEKFQADPRVAVRSLTSTKETKLVANLRLLNIENSPLTKTRMLKFEQTVESVPVFGSQAVVELDKDRKLVSVSANVVQLRGQSAIARISHEDALKRIAKKAHVPLTKLGKVNAPTLFFYQDEKRNEWHLVYVFRNVPAAPPEYLASKARQDGPGHGRLLAPSPRERRPYLNYIVDARNGSILLFYSATPTLSASLVIPTKCFGIDSEEIKQEFWGQRSSRGFEMNDPLRSIKTYDLLYGDMEADKIPAKTVYNTENDWEKRNKAAVSAHLNATRVYDFYNSVLLRKGVDNKGMDLVSVVNCTYQDSQHGSKEWRNACWWNDRMWYGQEKIGSELKSFSRYLDIIAHELTHGVTEYSSKLEYLNQSGALNESFSDIIAVIIKNWYTKSSTNSVHGWDWEIGSGMNGNGLPLRDLKNPKRTSDPDHMKDYLHTAEDDGGVHTNSNIHNKAAYYVLTAKDARGKYVFLPREAALLFYLCLVRLSSLATFSETLKVLLDVAKTYYTGDSTLKGKLYAIKKAYCKAGIT
jgi:Zn-dependent metalloprotease